MYISKEQIEEKIQWRKKKEEQRDLTRYNDANGF